MNLTAYLCKFTFFIIVLNSIFGHCSMAVAQSYYTIDEKVSKQELENLKYLIEPYLDKISEKDILLKKLGYFKVIRLIHKDLCWRDFCLNIIARNCNNMRCPSTVIIGPDKLKVQGFPVESLGLMIQFPTRIDDNYTTVIVNARYVAAFRGL